MGHFYRYGDAAAIAASKLAAQAALAADVLFMQTGDPADHLEVVVGADGMYSTQTLRNKYAAQQVYSQNKARMEQIALGGVGLAVVLLLVFRR